MNDREREITDAVERLQLARQFSRCEPVKAMAISRRAKEQFVTGNPRVWWLGFRPPVESHSYDPSNDWARVLRGAIPGDTTECWLIAESTTEDYPVYDAQIDAIVEVLKECSFFEYYLVDKAFSWLIADTDHNDILICRSQNAR